MEAIVKIGGRQYRAAEGQRLTVDRVSAAVGETVTLDQVLSLADGDKVSIGTPLVEGASVEARVLAATRGPKVLVYKYKPKKRYRRTHGHRQEQTLLEVTKVAAPGARKSRASAGAKAAPTEAKPAAPAKAEPEEAG